jgi:hypothetical protein
VPGNAEGHIDPVDEVRLEAAERDRLDRPENAGLVELRDRRRRQSAQPLRLGLAREQGRAQLLRATRQLCTRRPHRRPSRSDLRHLGRLR